MSLRYYPDPLLVAPHKPHSDPAKRRLAEKLDETNRQLALVRRLLERIVRPAQPIGGRR